MGKNIWEEFDDAVDIETLQKDIKDAEKNKFKEVPAGTYLVKFTKLEQGQTKDRRPMLKIVAKILDGEYKNSNLFMNYVLFGTKNDGLMITSAVEWLSELDAMNEDGEYIQVEFINYSQFAELVFDIAESIEVDDLVYEIEYDPSSFNNILITSVIEN